MSLISNGLRLACNPMLHYMGSATAHSVEINNSNRPGSIRNFYAGEATVISGASIANKSAFPSGYLHPSMWVLPQKNGGLSSRRRAAGEGDISSGNLAGGLAAAALLTGSGTISTALGELIAVAVATLSGSGTLTASIIGKIEAAAALSGSGDIAALLNAALLATASIGGSGTLTASMIAAASLGAILAGSGDVAAAGVLTAPAIAALSGSGGLTAAIIGKLEAVAALSGSGTVASAQLRAIGILLAAIGGSGSAQGTMFAVGSLLASINVTGSLLTTANVASSVWGALAAAFNEVGTMGQKMNSAASAGDPWGTALPGAYAEGTAGHKLGNMAISQLSDTATAGTSTTITLPAAASAVNDYYNGSIIVITSGTGGGQARRVEDYNGTTKVATVVSAWETSPDATSEFSIVPFAPVRVSDIDADVITAASIAADALVEFADAILKRDMSQVSGESARSLLNAIRFLRNKWSITGSTMTVTKEDDTTPAWTSALSTTANAEAIVASDPA